MKKKLQIALFVLLGAAGAAEAATLVVVEARGIAYRPGAAIDSGQPLELRQGQHLTLITETGSTIRLDGPYSGPPVAGGGGGVGLGQTLAALVAQRQSRSGEYGTTRGVTVAPLPEPWLLDVSHSGNSCLLRNHTPELWRPDAKGEAKIMVTPVDRSWKSQAVWPAGRNRLAITTDLPMRGGETYVVNFNGDQFFISMILLPASLTNDEMRAGWMANRGCEAQAQALVKPAAR